MAVSSCLASFEKTAITQVDDYKYHREHRLQVSQGTQITSITENTEVASMTENHGSR